RRVVIVTAEAERRIAVGTEDESVELDSPGPAHHAHVELEDRPRIAAGEDDRKPCDHAQDREGDPQETEDDQVRDHQDPFVQPAPAGRIVQAGTHTGGIGGGRTVHDELPYGVSPSERSEGSWSSPRVACLGQATDGEQTPLAFASVTRVTVRAATPD